MRRMRDARMKVLEERDYSDEVINLDRCRTENHDMVRACATETRYDWQDEWPPKQSKVSIFLGLPVALLLYHGWKLR